MSLSVLRGRREAKSAKSLAVIHPLSVGYILSARVVGQAKLPPESVVAAFMLEM